MVFVTCILQSILLLRIDFKSFRPLNVNSIKHNISKAFVSTVRGQFVMVFCTYLFSFSKLFIKPRISKLSHALCFHGCVLLYKVECTYLCRYGLVNLEQQIILHYFITVTNEDTYWLLCILNWPYLPLYTTIQNLCLVFITSISLFLKIIYVTEIIILKIKIY